MVRGDLGFYLSGNYQKTELKNGAHAEVHVEAVVGMDASWHP
jgi:hypothetical protein